MSCCFVCRKARVIVSVAEIGKRHLKGLFRVMLIESESNVKTYVNNFSPQGTQRSTGLFVTEGLDRVEF